MVPMDMLSLSQKVSLITGASSGIGRATAILFARLGSELALVGRDEKRLVETIESCKEAVRSVQPQPKHSSGRDPFIYIVADLSDTKNIDRVYDSTMKHFKKLDILVNNAGCLMRDSVENFSEAIYEETMNTNLRSAVFLTQKVVPALTETRGSVVNVSSVCGNRSFPGMMSYCMSKAALDQFTKCTALDLAPKGIRVNSVNPGVVITPLQRRGGMSEEDYARFLENTKVTHALGRPGEPDEVARAIAFLASSAASYTTGDLLLVDGGRSAMCPR